VLVKAAAYPKTSRITPKSGSKRPFPLAGQKDGGEYVRPSAAVNGAKALFDSRPCSVNHSMVLLGDLMAGWSDAVWWKAEPLVICASVGRYFGARVHSSIVRNERLVR
jgi:hypothetical protein